MTETAGSYITNTDVRLGPTADSFRATAAERAAAEYREPEGVIETWAIAADTPVPSDEAATGPGAESAAAPRARPDNWQRIEAQIVSAYDYQPRDGKLRDSDADKLQATMRRLQLLSRLGGPEGETGDIIDLALAHAAGADLVRLIWKEAGEMNRQWDRDREVAAKVAELEALATHDHMTGALNRRGEEALVRRWAQAAQPKRRRESEEPSAPKGRGVIDIDLAHFKRINSVLGERMGDALLVEAVRLLSGVGREEDMIEVIRYGGDEFRVVVGNMSEEVFDKLVERLRGQQEAKVADNRQQRIWGSLVELQTAIPQGTKGLTQAVFTVAEIIYRDADQPSTYNLAVSGSALDMPLEQLIVMSFGAAYGPVGSAADYEALAAEAHTLRLDHKEQLHTRMGSVSRGGEESALPEA